MVLLRLRDTEEVVVIGEFLQSLLKVSEHLARSDFNPLDRFEPHSIVQSAEELLLTSGAHFVLGDQLA
jgi:hypothetical protein